MLPSRSFVFALSCSPLLAFAQGVQLPQGPPYGCACGFVGVDPEPRTTIEALILRRDTAGIFSYLRDTSAVHQAYGAEAVIRLSRAGMAIPKHVLVIADDLRKSDRMVYVCSGCIYWMEEMRVALRDSMPVNNIR
ncbi:MAG: hypothetical protein JST41_12075 [Bacteroidetes bacterium]|nr:hypothetical protein [Bacteroidota bacterium]MBX7129874.1 hypothetical protein [Flavobacteriales bacterium]MCC6655785.1 hypothetical protein [Flavobacteriales bacterium]HMU12732.1 hypothetical protein [Flavobacteriales bacterium]HNA34391.1 hypothetical protein [Flavobacteriales bacterium]